MVRPADTPNIRLLSKVSTLYYDHEYTQQDIANRLEISRPKVSRLLKQAKSNGVVTITVSYPEGNYVDLESRIEEKYGLNEVIVVEVGQSGTSQNDNLIKSHLGDAAAKHLRRTVTKGDIIGVTWGTTLQVMADKIGALQTDNIHIVQMLGGFGPPEAKAHAMDISRRFSQSLNAKLTLLQSPGIVDTPEIKDVLLTDRRVKSALNLFPKINKAYVGIGAICTNNVLKKENAEISDDVQKEITNSKAVGDIGLNFFDKNGKIVKTDFQNRFIGMTLEQLKDVKNVIGIAGGKEKFAAIKGALIGGYIHVLITDQKTAKRLAGD